MGRDILRAIAGRMRASDARADTLRARLAEKWRGLSGAEQIALGGTLAAAIAGGFWLTSVATKSIVGSGSTDNAPEFRTKTTEELLALHNKSDGQKREKIASFCACRIHDVRDLLLDAKYVESATMVMKFHIARLEKIPSRSFCESAQLSFLDAARLSEFPFAPVHGSGVETPYDPENGFGSHSAMPEAWAWESASTRRGLDVGTESDFESDEWEPEATEEPRDWDDGLKAAKRAVWARERISEMPAALAALLYHGLTPYHEMYGYVSTWDVRRVTSMEAAFANAGSSLCDHIKDLSFWDTREVVDMSGMFFDALEFDGDIRNWDTRNVKSMSVMFRGAGKFNQDIGKWDTRKVVDMSGMFSGAANFSQDIGKWDTGEVKNMSSMFEDACSFSPDLYWNTAKVESMRRMFARGNSGESTFNGALVDWQTGEVTDMCEMFLGAGKFNQNIGEWDTSKVADMSGMFARATSFSQDLRTWKTGSVNEMGGMFFNAESFNADISEWDTSKVTSMHSTFQGATKLNRDLSGWDVKAVKTHEQVFYESGMAADIEKHPKFNLVDFGCARQAHGAQRAYV